MIKSKTVALALAISLVSGLIIGMLINDLAVPLFGDPIDEQGIGHGANPAPDRIILTWNSDPATTQAVSWRTDSSVVTARAQIAPADSVLPEVTMDVEGQTAYLESENGLAHFHSVRFTELRPGTLYAYRVGGDNMWSEWFQFRSAASGFEPFEFLYFGDVQNGIYSHWPRILRAAYVNSPAPRFKIFSGDLVNLRDGNHDNEWGDWFRAGDWMHATIPTIPAVGNHEYPRRGRDRLRVLSPHWRKSFALPEHGPPGFEETVYYHDYQGVRIIVLNSMEAVTYGRAQEQAAWLEPLLADNPHRWTIVVFHHPIHSAARERDNASLRASWQPLLERYDVDLVLQGHDHVYSRVAAMDRGDPGPVYVSSVAGTKFYELKAGTDWMDRRAQGTSFYQIVSVEWDRLRFETRLVTGDLYDAFEIRKNSYGHKTFLDRRPRAKERHLPANDFG
jgi:hypothetical protein